ncbi:hypothetical protein SAMN05428944_4831 [Streptomyces sp. 1222.5]|nr:hypothetical protein BX260_3266 [Streptomyces sp. 5112.2]SEC72611.1 hypothetical protein SAMN05428944_4831 [Streptomyces sp. 1222.5]
MAAGTYAKDRLEAAARASRTRSEALERLGVDPGSPSRRYVLERMRKLGVDVSHFEREGARWTREVLEPVVAVSVGINEVVRELGIEERCAGCGATGATTASATFGCSAPTATRYGQSPRSGQEAPGWRPMSGGVRYTRERLAEAAERCASLDEVQACPPRTRRVVQGRHRVGLRRRGAAPPRAPGRRHPTRHAAHMDRRGPPSTAPFLGQAHHGRRRSDRVRRAEDILVQHAADVGRAPVCLAVHSTVDHINGDWSDDSRSNLRLLCQLPRDDNRLVPRRPATAYSRPVK